MNVNDSKKELRNYKRSGVDFQFPLTPEERIENLENESFSGSGNTTVHKNGNEYIIYSPKNVVDVTYSELVNLISTSGLTKGNLYTITDFATTHYMLDVWDIIYSGGSGIINTGINEPLTVLATSVNTLDNVAYSKKYPQDIIYYDWNPDNWKYDLAFGGYDEEVLNGFKGVIHYRKDTKKQVEIGYDFRNVKFRRWKNGLSGSTFKSEYQEYNSSNALDENDYIDVLTFNCPESQYNTDVKNISIPPYRDDINEYYYFASQLSNIVFHFDSPEGTPVIYDIKFDGSAFNSTFNGDTQLTRIGVHFYNNILADSFINNNIDDSFYDNIIKGDFRNNTINSKFTDNTINGNFTKNTIDTNFTNNTISSFHSNRVANSFGNNTITGTHCNFNNFGPNFYGNTIDSFFYNTIKGPISNLNFTAATITPSIDYYCDIFKKQDGTYGLSYIDNGNTLVITGATS